MKILGMHQEKNAKEVGWSHQHIVTQVRHAWLRIGLITMVPNLLEINGFPV